MNRLCLSVILLALMAPMAWGKSSIDKLEVSETDLGWKIVLKGTSTHQGFLNLQFTYGSHEGPKHRVEIKDGAIDFSYASEKRFLPGKYQAALYSPKDGKQVATYPAFTIGTKKDHIKEKKQIKVHLIDLYHNICDTVLEVRRGGEYFVASLRNLRKKGDKQAHRLVNEVARNWGRHRTFLLELIKVSFHNLNDFENSIYINPHREVIENLKAILIVALDLNKKFTSWIDRWVALRKESESIMKGMEAYEKKLKQNSDKIAAMLGTKDTRYLKPGWLSKPNDYELSDGKYVDHHLKYSLKYDEDKWLLTKIPINPNIRLRLYRKGISRRRPLMVSVEIYKYDRSRSYEDLRTMSVISAQELWPGYRQLSSRSIKVKMNGVEYPGFDFVFITEDTKKRQSYKNRVYRVFLKDKKTVYGLRVFGHADSFEKYQKEFEKLVSTFIVKRK